MSNNINYGEIGFKCGIEIHQQLSTQQKLFCSCPVDLEDENPSYKIERYLRAVSGETGKTDIAAKHEDKKSRKYIYNYYDRNNCLVELDEEPPHEMDREALDTALKFARLVGADIPEEIQIMRKMVIDGSNTSGFQRTAMIGFNGEIETGEGKVKIDDIELEEESAGIHSTDEDKKVFDLNRLGIPLVEVGTDASIKNPKHAREVAKEIGMLLRSTGKARRGIGTIRQDVNISIEKGARVEIKGFQDVENIDKLIENEVKRQKNLVEIGENLPDKSNQIERIEVTEIFRNSDNQIINTVIENDGEVYGIKLPKLKGKMNKDISPNRYLAKELVDYAKNQGVNGLIHSGEDLEKYKLKDKFEKLSEEIEAGENDVIAIIAAEEEKAKNAAEAVENRAKKIYQAKIPEETRNAEQNFSTTFLRPLPGSARMYPETDVPPIEISSEKIKEIDENLPKTLKERKKEYLKEIGEEMAEQIINSRKLKEYEKYKKEANPKLVANVLLNILPRLKSEGLEIDKLEEKDKLKIFKAYSEDRVNKNDIPRILEKKIKEESTQIEEIIEKEIKEKADEDEIRKAVNQVIQSKEELIKEKGKHAQGALMGLVMEKIDAEGDKVSEILSNELKNKLD